ncbi:retrotransposon protein, putative, ty1-copia subclass [Tanacetum coccineum]|uniref:Retrotransposon protein, putative, ty1-copia subclass n=1 Tax=Tanacetum coccineum TaxID=301880 RepID=A0ABQ4Y6M6_9ASTR
MILNSLYPMLLMSPDLQRKFENFSPYDMLQEHKFMFEKQVGVERFDLIQTFHAYKQEEGQSISSFVLKMKSYVEQLERLGYVLPNYNMHNMGKTISELHALLIEYEKGLPKKDATPQVLTIHGGRIQKPNKKPQAAKGKGKGKGKGKNKLVYAPKSKNLRHVAKEHSKKEEACHHYKEGHRGERKLKQGVVYLYMGNGVHIQVEDIRSFDLVLPNGLVICLDNCHHAPTITRGVVSVSRLVGNEFIQRLTNYGILVSKNDILYFNVIPDMLNLVPNKHIGKLNHDGLLKSTDPESFDQCVFYLSGKMIRKPFLHQTERATDLFGLIHTDVCGPLRHVSRQGASYFITFTDDFIHYVYVYLLKHKHEVFETFKVFKNEVENQLRKTIKALRSDRGGKYISQEFKDYPKACGIVQQLTPPYTPQHNHSSERRNHTLLDMVRSMRNLTTLLLSFWDYALAFATHIPNMVPTKKGRDALVKRDMPDKLQQRSVKCIFVGYRKETMGYYFYFPPENKIVVARYAKFLENNLISQKASGRVVKLEEIQDEDTSPSENTSEHLVEAKSFEPPQEYVAPVRRSIRIHRAPERLCLNVEVEEHSLGDINEPTNYKDTLLDPESNKWLDAMNAEMQSMKDNQVWRLVDLPPNAKTIGTKGYTQSYGIDYEEFSHVVDIISIRILIAIAAYYDYEIWQIEVKTAFLNGYLDEDIYMVQPEGFIDSKHPKKVCKLQRSIYGLKQASRSWKKRFDDEIKKFGFTQNLDDPCASTPEEVKCMLNVLYASVVGSIINNKDMFLVYGGNPKAELRVTCYYDGGIETYRDDIKSQTGYVFILNGGVVD